MTIMINYAIVYTVNLKSSCTCKLNTFNNQSNFLSSNRTPQGEKMEVLAHCGPRELIEAAKMQIAGSN